MTYINMQIKFEVDWEVQLSRNLRVAWSGISDLTSFIKDALEIVHNRSNDLWAKKWQNLEKSPNWPALASRTQKARERRWWIYKSSPNNPQIMRWTWNLQDNVTKKSSKNEGILSYNAPYAIYHQQWSKNLPKRAIIDLSSATNNEIVKSLQMKINKDLWIFGKQL